MTPQQTFLGQILQNNDVYYQASPVAWWFDGQDRVVFNAIESVLEQGLRADVATVGSKVQPAYVASLTSGSHTTANWPYFAEKCKRAGMREELRRLAVTIGDEVKQKQPDEVVETITNAIDRIISGTEEYKIMAMKDLLPGMVTELEDRYNKRGMLAGLQTGFKTLDSVVGGLQPQKLYVIGARPSQGKSAIALNIANHISAGVPVGFISLESSWKEVLIREIAATTGIDSSRLTSGYFKNTDFDALINGAERLSNKKLYIYDKPNSSLVEVIGQARRMVKRFGVKCIFIDYLQLIQTKEDDDRKRVAHVSKALKNLSRELKVPVVALAQLRRDSEGRRPGLGDFQHSSQIEQDADGGLLMWWRVYDRASEKWVNKNKPDPGNPNEEQRFLLLVEKNRDGRTGDIELNFNPSLITFQEAYHDG